MTADRSPRAARRWPRLITGVLAAGLALGSRRLDLQVGRDPTRERTSQAIDLLEYYNLGEYEAVRTALVNAASGDLGVVLQALKRDAATWIASDGPRLAPRRRLTVAMFALDVARAGLDHQWVRSQEILEWSCALLRKEREPGAAERTWHLAALALIEGARDMRALDQHVAHLKSLFPDEPRLLLVDAFRRESEYWNLIYTISGVADGGAPGGVIPALETAKKRRENEREANLRLGYLLERAGRFPDAIETLGRVAPGDDPGQLYLSQLFLGWAYDGLDRTADAERAFRAAIDAMPGAEVATLALAVHLYERGRRDEADTLTDEMLGRQPRVIDPWRIYGYGDLRRWPALMDKLRTEIAAQ
jgi:tetratricopeptide (TPR) repeat protein